MKKKNIKIGLVALLLLFLGWYLFIKENDYLINFKVTTATGTVFQGIQEWSKSREKGHNEHFITLKEAKYDFIKQEMTKGKTRCIYSWEIQSVNDSTSSVSIGIKEFENSLYNRITAPFWNTTWKKNHIERIKDFKKGLEEHIKNFKVKIEGEATSEATDVAYINLKSVMQEKAQTMIMNDGIITGFLQKNNIKIIGRPYLEINTWDKESEKLDFNYCFPIDKNTSKIQDPQVKFKTLPAKKGLQATYYGNFRTSDRGWFALLDYAKRNKISISNKPLEHFLANPFNGGNELEWQTKIIIPISIK